MLSSIENVELPLKLTNLNKKERMAQAERALKLVNFLTLLSRLNKEFGKTIVMVTHDPHAAAFASKARHLEKGELLPEGAMAV